MTAAIDLFAGLGGFTAGARAAGCNVVWAANHSRQAVDWHARNHPEVQHECQDLHQANWAAVPRHNFLLASPCCQGHSKARGKKKNNKEHDASRSTAWAVVSACEVHLPEVALVENVREFLEWDLYPAWRYAMESLGYQIAPHIIDAADLGAPQHRVRLFLVCTRSKAPLMLNLTPEPHRPARDFIDFNAGDWSPVDRPGRAAATLERVRAGRQQHGDTFLISYYGNTKTGRSIDRPVGTITTKDRWAIVCGNYMRMFNRWECRDAMSFPGTYELPDNHSLAVQLMGNAVCPEPVTRLINAIQEAA